VDRRRFLLTSLAGALSWPLGAEALQASHVVHIGVLYPASHRCAHAFRQGLVDLGYVEGRTIAFEYRSAVSFEENVEQARDLTRRKVDIIVAPNGRAAQAAQQVTRAIPIVAFSVDVVETGLVTSLARPGGNITGISVPLHELAGKRLEILKSAVPAADRIAAFIVPSPLAAKVLHDHDAAARALGVTLYPINVSDRAEFEAAFQNAVRVRAGALVLTQGPFFSQHKEVIAALALKHRLPMLSSETGSAEAGSLLYYGASTLDACRQLARFAQRIINGAKPADLPVEQPTRFELIINLKTAKALGLTIPPSLLARADQVIE
jgi:putative tryptophan/tyrosine transport system substrate-binding protein